MKVRKPEHIDAWQLSLLLDNRFEGEAFDGDSK
jgi:hypothetical protein